MRACTLLIALSFLAACSSYGYGGTVHDEAEIPLRDVRVIRLPVGAEVCVDADADFILVQMDKTLGFVGHPPREISIREGSRIMGVATRKDGDVMEIATYGEWDSHLEGGARIENLRFVVPQSVAVERGDGLAGEDSKAQGFERDDALPRDYKETYWYAPTKPAVGWTSYPGD
jgi:hypothetical protein